MRILINTSKKCIIIPLMTDHYDRCSASKAVNQSQLTLDWGWLTKIVIDHCARTVNVEPVSLNLAPRKPHSASTSIEKTGQGSLFFCRLFPDNLGGVPVQCLFSG